MRFYLSIFVAALIFAAPAKAQMVDRFDAESVGAVITALGLTYGETTDNRGFPLLQIQREQDQGNFAATTTNILFYGCEADGCKDITLYSWYQPPSRVGADAVHEWNDIFRQTRNWSRAYIDEEGDPTLVMNINAEGGIGQRAFEILLFSYLQEAQDFGRTVGIETSE